ncbi:MAG: asparagine synthase (glutamine-hydrolyzing) [Gemmataceae bacterium]|nr:asparagine synthase (glutamine-hydrolyzing) [Gemmataceae bacterium]
MCGIAGLVGVDVRQEQLAAMAAAMFRRGPDDQGFYCGPQIGLAFRRLAIVDLAGGRQPMENEDGAIHLVFNGEIYDHHLLRRQLEDKGHRFVTDHSDTEVLVHGWEEWGYDLFPKLNGMFAVAIWNEKQRTLVLARDRYGIKPLYLAKLPSGGLAFASEIKPILASGLLAAKPNAAGVLEYLTFQNLVQHQTMFAGVEQADPASITTWRDGRFSTRKYWDLTFPRSRKGSLESLAEEHRAILKRSLQRQIAADVPVKTYLSGGIDSTAITVGSHQLDQSVTAYSCIFDLDGVGADRGVDEREYSRLVAKAYDLERVEFTLPQDSLPQSLHDYVWSMEDLRMGIGYPVYWIARRVAQDAKVVLSGTGGDEFHAGYVGRYQQIAMAAGLEGPGFEFSLRGLKRVAKRLLKPQPSFDEVFRNMVCVLVKPKDQRDAFTPEFLASSGGFDPNQVYADIASRCPSRDWRDRMLYVDAKTYLAGLLWFEDKVSMAHSIETRVPLLDNELVDFVLDVPFDLLRQGDTGKILFRESVRSWVPPEIYTKPKMGFGPPDASWYRGKLRPWIEERLTPKRIAEAGIFRPEFVRRILDEHFSGARDNYHFLWSFLNLEMWRQAFGFFGASKQGAHDWTAAAAA